MPTDRGNREGRSIARRLDFHGPQSNYFGIAPANGRAIVVGGFTGSVAQGGSCNAELLEVSPHCHGTHTEGIGHITEARHDVLDVVPSRRLWAQVISLPARRAHDTDDQLPPVSQPDDAVLTRADLQQARPDPGNVEALVIRTLPNPIAKSQAQYTDSRDYPYFTLDAMAWVVATGVTHLLIDTPSLDRLDDGGHLAVHRLYWGMPPGGRDRREASRADATVTEMIYVPDDVEDGYYWLALQPAPFSGDATPSNPTLYEDPEQ